MARQERLFDPGPKGPDRWKLHPDKWVQDPNVVYHASGQATLPRKDRGEGTLGYGSARGMHFGDKATAIDRGMEKGHRNFVHTARLDPVKIMNVPQFTEVMSDHDANFSDKAEKAVNFGAVVPYRNEIEDQSRRGENISYRVLPERTKTWSEDVQADPNAHPALKHLAEKGYNPTVNMTEAKRTIDAQRSVMQPQLFAADVVEGGGRSVQHHITEDDAFMGAQALNGRKRTAGQYPNASVKRNNQAPSFFQSEAAEKAPHRLTRPR